MSTTPKILLKRSDLIVGIQGIVGNYEDCRLCNRLFIVRRGGNELVHILWDVQLAIADDFMKLKSAGICLNVQHKNSIHLATQGIQPGNNRPDIDDLARKVLIAYYSIVCPAFSFPLRDNELFGYMIVNDLLHGRCSSHWKTLNTDTMLEMRRGAPLIFSVIICALYNMSSKQALRVIAKCNADILISAKMPADTVNVKFSVRKPLGRKKRTAILDPNDITFEHRTRGVECSSYGMTCAGIIAQVITHGSSILMSRAICMINAINHIQSLYMPHSVWIPVSDIDSKVATEKMPSAPSIHESMCVICLMEEACMVAIPCGHVGTCISCWETYSISGDNNCPLCRIPVHSAIRIFRP